LRGSAGTAGARASAAADRRRNDSKRSGPSSRARRELAEQRYVLLPHPRHRVVLSAPECALAIVLSAPRVVQKLHECLAQRLLVPDRHQRPVDAGAHDFSRTVTLRGDHGGSTRHRLYDHVGESLLARRDRHGDRSAHQPPGAWLITRHGDQMLDSELTDQATQRLPLFAVAENDHTDRTLFAEEPGGRPDQEVEAFA